MTCPLSFVWINKAVHTVVGLDGSEGGEYIQKHPQYYVRSCRARMICSIFYHTTTSQEGPTPPTAVYSLYCTQWSLRNVPYICTTLGHKPARPKQTAHYPSSEIRFPFFSFGLVSELTEAPFENWRQEQSGAGTCWRWRLTSPAITDDDGYRIHLYFTALHVTAGVRMSSWLWINRISKLLVDGSKPALL
jgi:hypothetical protein